MGISLRSVKKLIDIALFDNIGSEPPEKLIKFCDGYYQPYYHLLYLLSKHAGEGLRVELGVEKGRGIAAMAMGNTYRCIGYDNNLSGEAKVLSKIFSHVGIYHSPSLPVPLDMPKNIVLLHIDTEHSYAMARAEFEAYQPYLVPGAVVCFDDLHAQDDDVLRFFNELPYPKVQDDRLHPSCGYGVMVYE